MNRYLDIMHNLYLLYNPIHFLLSGCCPTEAEIQEVILATENKEATGNVPLTNFLPFMCKVMIEHRLIYFYVPIIVPVTRSSYMRKCERETRRVWSCFDF